MTLGTTARRAGAAIAVAVLIEVGVPQGSSAQSSSANVSTVSAREASDKGYEAYKRQDYAKAFYWFRKAADQGDADAQERIGDMYAQGWGVAQDFGQAIAWYRKAAAQADVYAQFNIGIAYFTGQGVAQNYAEAMSWFRKVADKETPASDPNASANRTAKVTAQLHLGVMYQEGLGVAKDAAKARDWYRKAAELGDADAKTKLAQLDKAANVKAETLNLVCRNPRGTTPIFIDTASRTVRIETGHPIEFKDGAKYYVRITNDVIEFGCRKAKTDQDMIADGVAWMLGDNSKKGWASDTMCVARNRIDRHTGIWTASRTGAITGPMSDSAECR